MKNRLRQITAGFFAVLLLAATFPVSAVAQTQKGDDFVQSLSPMTVDAASGIRVYEELTKYFLGGETYSTAPYETYLPFEVDVGLYCSKDATGIGRNASGRDVIVYVYGYAGERIGMEEDVSILRDYLLDGYAVVTVDYKNHPDAKSPDIEHSLSKLRTYLMSAKLIRGNGLALHADFFYFLPAGYRLARDIWYWNSYNYSSLGTRNHVITAWNRCLAEGGKNNKKAYNYTSDFTLTFDGVNEDGTVTPVEVSHKANERIKEVTYIQECCRKNGDPLRYDVFLDIIYPSLPKYATPVYSMIATDPNRHWSDATDLRCTYAGMTFEGYTTVLFDYAYVPMSNYDTGSYSYIDYYGTHGENVLKTIQAAIRCLRYYAADYGYDASRIGVSGISKGSPGAAAISVVDNAVNSTENRRFEKDLAASAKYGVDFCFEGDMIKDGERITLNQPFLYYDVPYGPVTDEHGNTKTDIYGNLITYEYYGTDGVAYVRNEGRQETDPDFRTPIGKSIAKDYDVTKVGEDRCVENEEKGDYRIESDVQAVYCAAGDGTKRLYGTGSLAKFDKVPMLLSCGQHDQYGCFDYWYQLAGWFAKNANAPFLAITMLDQGHNYPTGYDDVYGFRRHDAFITFFNHYLKPEETSPEVVWCTPLSIDESVDEKTKVKVKFYDKMDTASIGEGLMLLDLTTGKRIDGTWEAGECDTLFTFSGNELTRDTAYAVVVTTACRDVRGVTVRENIVYRFGVRGEYTPELLETAIVNRKEPDRTFDGGALSVNKDTILLASFANDHLAGAETIRLGLTVDSETPVGVTVYAIPSYRIKANVKYSSLPTLIDEMLVGSFSLKNGKSDILLTALGKRELGDTFTLVFVSDASAYIYRMIQDFEGLKEGTLPRDTEKDNHCFSDSVIAIGGAPNSYTVTTEDNTTPDGRKCMLLTATHGYDRVKFFNSFKNSALTKEDIGREFDISFMVRTEQKGRLTCGVMSFNGGSKDSGYTGPASSYGTNFCGASKTVYTEADEWTLIEDHITITEKMVEAQAGLYTIQTSSATSENRLFWFDDVEIREVQSAYTNGLYEKARFDVFDLVLSTAQKGTENHTPDSVINGTSDNPMDEPSCTDPSRTSPKFLVVLVVCGASVAVVAAAAFLFLRFRKK